MDIRLRVELKDVFGIILIYLEFLELWNEVVGVMEREIVIRDNVVRLFEMFREKDVEICEF